jgi:plasmid maintenance system antidote protein VapI
MAVKNPSHAGDFIRTEIVEPVGLSVMDAARALHFTHASRPAPSGEMRHSTKRPPA